jgi:hypothetical protein
MKMLEALRKRRSQASRRASQALTSPPDEHPVPISGYDQLGDKQVGDRLSQLSQVELATVETYERAHGNRPAVLEKLRYMQGSEPVPGYDTLTPEQISEALAGADAETVRAVRDYERKFQRRRSVLDEAARVLPTSRVSAREERAHEEKAALLSEGYADRERTAPDPPE